MKRRIGNEAVVENEMQNETKGNTESIKKYEQKNGNGENKQVKV